MKKLLIVAALLLFSSVTFARVNLVTTTTDLAWAAREIGGKHVKVKALLTGSENVHYVDVVPSYVLAASNADIVCIVGLDLEIGWIGKVLQKSGNSQVQPGGKGYCETGKKIVSLNKPTGKIDRSMGDIHSSGNPHFWLSPIRFAQGAEAILDALVGIDQENAEYYLQNNESFKLKMSQLHKDMKNRLDKILPTKDLSFIQYHTDFSYFLDAYGIKSFGSI